MQPGAKTTLSARRRYETLLDPVDMTSRNAERRGGIDDFALFSPYCGETSPEPVQDSPQSILDTSAPHHGVV